PVLAKVDDELTVQHFGGFAMFASANAGAIAAMERSATQAGFYAHHARDFIHVLAAGKTLAEVKQATVPHILLVADPMQGQGGEPILARMLPGILTPDVVPGRPGTGMRTGRAMKIKAAAVLAAT